MYRQRQRASASRRGRPGTRSLSPLLSAFAVLPRQWRRMSRRWRFTATGGVLAAAIVAGYLVLTSGGPPPRARQYLAFKACLLTGSHGVTEKETSPIWAGMGDASLKTRAQIQYLPVFGPDTVANALPYLRSLVQRRCDVIVASGQIPAQTVSSAAARYPRIRFIAIGGDGTARNLTSVNPNDPQTPVTVKRLIINAVEHPT
jgi:hypothetical protein